MNGALLIPCYEPSEKVLTFLSSFTAEDFSYFLLVDDGSGEHYQNRFKEIEEKTVFHLLSYPNNKGKGGALKTGIAHILKENENIDYIVTCDSDGQHIYEDVLKIRNAMEDNPEDLVLGVRRFASKDVPLRSKFGNNFSKLYFKMVTKCKCEDTQTGLRGIPANLFDLALNTNGNRFEYEMNFLMDAVRETHLTQISIATVYEVNEKHVSHFKTIKDSYLIYKTPLWYILASLMSFGIDVLAFAIFSSYVFTDNSEQQVFISNLIARVISGTFNFFMLNFIVFKNTGKIGTKAIKYWLLWGANYGLSSALTYIFSYLPMALSFVKVIFDTVIAVVNYILNLTVVFAKKKVKGKRKEKQVISKRGGYDIV